jgi:hypothetical protein
VGASATVDIGDSMKTDFFDRYMVFGCLFRKVNLSIYDTTYVTFFYILFLTDCSLILLISALLAASGLSDRLHWPIVPTIS